MTDSLERFLRDLDFDVPAGLVERAKTAAIGIDKASLQRSPEARESVREASTSQVGRTRGGFRWDQEARHDRAWALIAAVLVVAVVATLLVTAHLARSSHPAPAPAGEAPQAQTGTYVVTQPFLSPSDAAVLVNESRSTLVPASLEITHDGGQTWIRSGVTAAAGIDVSWLDSQHLLVESVSAGSPPVWQMTADGGYHWRIISNPQLPPSDEIGLIRFLDRVEGWDISCRGCTASSEAQAQFTTWHTIDSGAHWQQLGNPFSWPGLAIRDFDFVDSQHGFMSAIGDDFVGRLLSTKDGGVTWHLIDLPPPAGGWSQLGGSPRGCEAGHSCSLLPAIFGQQGVLLVTEPSSYESFTFTTADGGLTWTNPRVLTVQASPETPLSGPWQAALDPDKWWMVDSQGILHRTDDGGNSWQSWRPTLPAGYTLEYAKPVSTGILWGFAAAPGSHHILVRSSDGGVTWSTVRVTPYLTLAA